MKSQYFEIHSVPEKSDDGTISESFRVTCPAELDGYRETRPLYFPSLHAAQEWVRVQLVPVPPPKLVKIIPAKPSKAQRLREKRDAELRAHLDSENSELHARLVAREQREPYVLALIAIVTIAAIISIFF